VLFHLSSVRIEAMGGDGYRDNITVPVGQMYLTCHLQIRIQLPSINFVDILGLACSKGERTP